MHHWYHWLALKQIRYTVTKFRDSISVTSLQQMSILNELSCGTP